MVLYTGGEAAFLVDRASRQLRDGLYPNIPTTGNGVSVAVRSFVDRLLRVAFLGSAALAMPGAGPAHAAASDWWRTEHGAVRLIAASNAAGQTRTVQAGLHFRMNEGWKIYWRSPGDAGFPPRPSWAGSRNLAEARLSWPAPKRFSVLGLETLGYAGEVVLPIAVAVREPGKAVTLRAKVPYLTCDDICVPYEADLAFTLPAGPETSSQEQGLIESYRARVPVTGENGPLRIEAAAAVGGATTTAIELRLLAEAPLAKPDVYVEGAEGWAFGAPQYRLEPGGRAALIRIAALAPPKTAESLAGSLAESPAESLVGRQMRLTAVDGDRAIERSVVLGAPAAAAPPARGLAVILALAVLGGLILNLMPCVLPVLSLKLLSVMGHGGGQPGEVRAGFLASSAGILVSFLALGSGAVALRLAGESAGWGIQFQQPLFLVFMALIVALFAANLFGLFEIRLPGSISDFALAAGGSGHGIGGHFLTGAFAALLATPCSAPFLGTAVGFALSRGPLEIYAVFLALGIGLALPYLAVAAFPGIATRMPRPGPWMVTLRHVLGVVLAVTAIWLLSVLAVQTGAGRAAAIGIALVALVVGLALVGSAVRARSGAGFAISGAAAALALALAVWPGAGPGQNKAAAGKWTDFDRARIAREVAAGKVVFVDVTADWCITCRVNKALVLDASPVSDRLGAPELSAMRADWTRPNDEIAAYLKSFGRYGIPFNVVYGPDSPGGIPLPEILTEKAVMDALARAGAKTGGPAAATKR